MLPLWTCALLFTAQPPADLVKPPPEVAKLRTAEAKAKAEAWRYLVHIGPDALLPVLGELDTADAVAANWYRTAVEAIVEQALVAKKPLPLRDLEAFVADRKHGPMARLTAYEGLVKADPKAPDRLLPGMLDDPCQELRRDAVARALPAAEKAGKDALLTLFKQARDRDQVQELAKLLEKHGEKVDLIAHYCFLTEWALLGPFDNHDGVGFAKAYPPEGATLPMAPVPGKNGPVEWRAQTTSDPYALTDLSKLYDKVKGAVIYAVTEVEVAQEMAVQVRVGTPNALKIFVNGTEIFSRVAYHHGDRMDQHIAACKLKPGRNVIMLKLCQNEQAETWAQKYYFQCRVCDDLGGAVFVKPVSPSVLTRKGG
jgi:hypothetical protein